jgi:signal transduction histidine kinase
MIERQQLQCPSVHLRFWLRPPGLFLAAYIFVVLSAAVSIVIFDDESVTLTSFALVSTAGVAILIAAAIHHRGLMRLQYDFLYALSHELRTPLTSMRQLTENLVTGRVPSEDRRLQYYQVLHRDSETLVQLVERLLDFGRVEAGVIQYRFQVTSAQGIIHDVVTQFRAKIADRGYTVEDHIDIGETLIRADRDALSRSIWNLLDNAVKYSPECKTVWIEAHVQGQSVVIRVRDQGVGIRREDQKKIFNFFVRGDSAKTIGAKGTGLGLAIVDILVQAHGGRVDVESAPGAGSTFSITIPTVRQA